MIHELLMAPIRLVEMVLRWPLIMCEGRSDYHQSLLSCGGCSAVKGLISPALGVEAGEPASEREKSYDVCDLQPPHNRDGCFGAIETHSKYNGISALILFCNC